MSTNDSPQLRNFRSAENYFQLGRWGRHLGIAVSFFVAGGLVSTVAATPFDTCPSKAFLIQKTIPTLYGVNLATGYYKEFSSQFNTTAGINALAFNTHDNYLYGWSYEYGSPVRISSTIS